MRSLNFGAQIGQTLKQQTVFGEKYANLSFKFGVLIGSVIE